MIRYGTSYPPQLQRYPGPPGLLAFVPYNEQIDFQQFLLDFFGVWKKERNRQFYRARSYYRRSKFNSSSPQISFTTSYSINTYLVSPLRDFDESVKIQKIMKISSSSSSLSSTQIKSFVLYKTVDSSVDVISKIIYTPSAFSGFSSSKHLEVVLRRRLKASIKIVKRRVKRAADKEN